VVGAFCRTPSVQPETKGFENPFQISPTPCKKHKKPTKQSRGTIREWNCALKIKIKMEEKFGFFGGDWVSEFWGKEGNGGGMEVLGVFGRRKTEMEGKMGEKWK
jgi:hypothetical protein